MTTDPPKADDPASVRLAHLRLESDIKSVGQFCYLVATFGAMGTLEFSLVAAGVLPYEPRLDELAAPYQIRFGFTAFAALMFLNALGQAALGYGLIRLQAWARWTVVALTGLSLVSGLGLGLGLCFAYPLWGLLGLAAGVAVHGLILYPLLTPSSAVVFSREYREIIRATPEIRGRMHLVLKLTIGAILAGVVGLVGYLLALYLRIID